MAIVKVQDVSKIYNNVRAVDDISLEIAKGEWVSIMGPSGSGKSTLLNLVSCLDQPSSGSKGSI